MSMFEDVMGFGRTSVMESMMGGFEPELEETTLESVEELGDGVDPMDFMLQVAYENEMNMKNLDIAIMAEEYVFLRESGQEMIYEDTKLQSIIDKFKSGVKWLWEQIQKFFKTVQKKFDEILKLDDRFLDKYKDKAAGKTAMINGWDIEALDCDAIADIGETSIKNIREGSDRVFEDLVNNDKTTKYEDFMKSMEASLKAATGKSSVKELYRGALTSMKKDAKKERSYSADKAIELFGKSKAARTRLKDFYNENKKAINSQIKTAKKMETVAKKSKVVPTETSKAIHGTVKVLNKCGSYITLTNKTYVKFINMARAQLKAIIVAAAAKDNATTTGSAGSSSTAVAVRGESASFVDMVDFGMTF